MSRRVVVPIACSLLGAAAPLAAQDAPPAGGSRTLAIPAWGWGWSALRPIAELPRGLPAAPALPDLLSGVAPRAGLAWRAGNPAALPFELEDARTDFFTAAASASGDYRRPLDPESDDRVRLGGAGWRTLGANGAGAGRVLFDRGRRDPVDAAARIEPYTSNPLLPTDTTAPAMGATRVLLEGAGGWRLGGWGLGLAVAYQVRDDRSDASPVPRLLRRTTPAVTGGIARELMAGALRLGVHARWAGPVEVTRVAPAHVGAVINHFKGHAVPEPDILVPRGPVFRARSEEHAEALGAGAAGRLAGIAWSLSYETHSLSVEQSIAAIADPPLDRWTAEGSRLGAAAVRPLGAGSLALLVERAEVSGFAERSDLDGIIFRGAEELLAAAAEARMQPGRSPWGGAVRVSLAREESTTRDAIDEVSSRVASWTSGIAVEAVRRLGDAAAISLGYAGALYNTEATLPADDGEDDIFDRLIAPELGLAATPAAVHGGALRFRWTFGSGRALTAGLGYRTLAPREVVTAFAPTGRRNGWTFSIRMTTGMGEGGENRDH